MIKMLVFRDFCRNLRRALFASIVCVCGVLDSAWANDTDYIINLNTGSGTYSNTPTPRIYGYKYAGDGHSSGASSLYLNGPLPLHNLMRPVPNPKNPVEIPNNPAFMGYYNTNSSSGEQCINEYGELTHFGANGALLNYQPGNANVYTWYARYAPNDRIYLASPDAEDGHHGKKFLYYKDHNLYREYDSTNNTYSVQMTPSNSNSRIVFDDLPSRNGYNFAGFWNVPYGQSGGVMYISDHSDGGTLGTVTNNGLSAVSGYTGGEQVWYAHWTPHTYTLKHSCNNGISNQLNYDCQPIPYGTMITPGTDYCYNPINCTPPNGDDDFVGWACGTNDATFAVFPSGGLSVNNNSFNGPDGLQITQNPFPIERDTICYAIWYHAPNCDPGTLAHYTLGLEGYSVDYAEGGSLSGNVCTFGSYGSVELQGMCSPTAGVFGMQGNPAISSDEFVVGDGETVTGTSGDGRCWCRVSGYTPNGGTYTPLGNIMPWVYDGTDCVFDYDCSNACAKSTSGGGALWRQSLYDIDLCQYELVYDCNNGVSGQDGMSGGNYAGGQLNISLWSQSGNTVGDCDIADNGTATFNGWTCYNDPDDGNTLGVTNGAVLNTMPYGNVRCVADWVPQSYTVTYNCDNGVSGQSGLLDTGSSHNPNTNYWYGETVTLWAPNQAGTSVGSCTVPANKVFNGWDCVYDNEDAWAPQQSVSGYDGGLYSSLYLVGVNDDETQCAAGDANCDVPCDNVICTAVWGCDTANGYYLNSATQTCTNEYKIVYLSGAHGTYIDGYNSSVAFGPGVGAGGGTYGQTWTTKTSVQAHIGPADACYEFCGWSENYYDTCGSNTIYAGGTAQGTWTRTSTLNLYAIWQCATDCVSNGNGQCVVPAPQQYNVTYDCDNAENPNVSNPATTPVTIGSPYSLADVSVCKPRPGYHLTTSGSGIIGGGWRCKPTVSGTQPSYLTSVSGTWPSTATSDYKCTAQWTRNRINLDWVDPMNEINTGGFSSSCNYFTSNTINLVYPNGVPERPGFTFNGWMVTDWDECGLKSGDVKNHIDDGMNDYGWLDLNYDHGGGLDGLLTENQTWVLSFSYGRVYGQSLCNNDNETAVDDGNYGPVCWCRVTAFESDGGEMCELYVSNQWYRLQDGDGEDCKTSCVQKCVEACGDSGEDNNFRKKLYGWN